MTTSPYCRTDLAIEATALSEPCSGILHQEEMQNNVKITAVTIKDQEGERRMGRPIGRYITLSFDSFWDSFPNGYEDDTREDLQKTLTKEITSLLKSHTTPKRILVVGLGNRAITADAIGPFVAERIDVTGHLQNEPALKDYLPSCHLYGISPGVVGKTGIETLSLIQGALKASEATHVVVIDALAALSVDRLGKTIQLTDTGIVPGSGVGNHRAALNRETLGVPVIAIGVPLVVSSSTLVWDALEKANVDTPNESLHRVLENGKSFFVTLKDCDIACELLAGIVANAVNLSARQMT